MQFIFLIVPWELQSSIYLNPLVSQSDEVKINHTKSGLRVDMKIKLNRTFSFSLFISGVE